MNKILVRFLVYYTGDNTPAGVVKEVDSDWARRAAAAGLVEIVHPETPAPVK